MWFADWKFRHEGNCSASRGSRSDAEQLYRVTEFSIHTEQSFQILLLAYSSFDLFILVGLGRSYFIFIFLSVAWPTGVQLLVFFCSSFLVELFDTQRISRCRSQDVVSVESWSLFRHSIYLWFVCFPWWSIDELENNNYMFWAIWQKLRAKLGSRKTPHYFNTDRSKAVHLLWFLTVACSCCPYL